MWNPGDWRQLLLLQDDVPGLEHPGFPIAEVEADGSCVITKHENTGGEVSIGTVTAQLLYELGSPAYLNPDVTARFDSIELRPDGDNRVRIGRVRGQRPPSRLKVAINTSADSGTPQRWSSLGEVFTTRRTWR